MYLKFFKQCMHRTGIMTYSSITTRWFYSERFSATPRTVRYWFFSSVSQARHLKKINDRINYALFQNGGLLPNRFEG